MGSATVSFCSNAKSTTDTEDSSYWEFGVCPMVDAICTVKSHMDQKVVKESPVQYNSQKKSSHEMIIIFSFPQQNYHIM